MATKKIAKKAAHKKAPLGKFEVYHSLKTGEWHVKVWNPAIGRYVISKTFGKNQKSTAEAYAKKRRSEK